MKKGEKKFLNQLFDGNLDRLYYSPDHLFGSLQNISAPVGLIVTGLLKVDNIENVKPVFTT